VSAPKHQLSLHFRFLLALVTHLRSQQLLGIDTEPSRVYLKKLPVKRDQLATAGLYVHPVPEQWVGRDSATDIFRWGAAVTLVSAPHADETLTDEEQINRQLLNREKLYDSLLPMTDAVLQGCGDFLRQILIEPGEIFNVAALDLGFDVQQLIVRGEGNKPRGMQYAR
jgi:hypothetical protein